MAKRPNSCKNPDIAIEWEQHTSRVLVTIWILDAQRARGGMLPRAYNQGQMTRRTRHKKGCRIAYRMQ